MCASLCVYALNVVCIYSRVIVAVDVVVVVFVPPRPDSSKEGRLMAPLLVNYTFDTPQEHFFFFRDVFVFANRRLLFVVVC